MIKKFNTNYMVKIAVMGMLSFFIMLIEIPLPITPEFLKMDLSDLPAIIGGFSLGPLAGILIELLKILLKLAIRGTTTMGVGELANFLVGSIFVIVSVITYKKINSKKGLVLGLFLGTIIMSLVASALNYTVLLPFYSKAYGLPLKTYIDMAKSVNSYVIDLRSFIVFGIFPFNIIKGVIISIISYPIYIRLRDTIEK